MRDEIEVDVRSTPATDGRHRIAALADELLPALIAHLGASHLGELEVREGTWRVRLRRTAAPSETETGRGIGRDRTGGRAGTRPGGLAVAVGPVRGGPGRATAHGGNGSGHGRESAPHESRTPDRRVVVTSPAVGYFAPRDDLIVGHPVRGGDLLGHVDVLGVRQEVVAPDDGVVGRLLAQPGEAVEYGQELVWLDRLLLAIERGGTTATSRP